MKCHFCGAPDTKVVDSRPTEDGASIRRRRECTSCGKRFTTYEKYEENNTDGMVKSCEKRPVPLDVLEAAAQRIEKKILREPSEIPSRLIGEYIMEELKGIDPVAYVRFASVYREFKDLDSFSETIDTLKREG